MRQRQLPALRCKARLDFDRAGAAADPRAAQQPLPHPGRTDKPCTLARAFDAQIRNEIHVRTNWK
jgi:hypothetical protein